MIITRVGNELYWEAELVLRQYLNSVDHLSCQLDRSEIGSARGQQGESEQKGVRAVRGAGNPGMHACD